MKKLTLLVAAGAGYVLGAKAGRERYEQIMAGARRVKQDPRVQAQAHRAAETVREQAPAMAGAVKDKAAETAAKVRSSDDQSVPSGSFPRG
ncbi:MAG: hypothetical protein ACXVWU_06750 [Nocardioides sp.]